MDNSTLTFLIIIIFADLAFTILRGSLVHARLPRLMDMRAAQPEAADALIRLLDLPRLRVTLRVVAVMIHFLVAGGAWLAVEQIALQVAFPWLELGVLLGAALLTLVLEYAIEGLVARKAETWALRMSSIIRLVDFVVRPLSGLMVLMLGENASQRGMGEVTDDELKIWAEDDHPEGGLEKGERAMIYSIFQFSGTLCREIMVPRIEVFALDENTSLEDAMAASSRSGHSRIPLYSGTIDQIVGIMYVKDLLRMQVAGDDKDRKLPCREPYFVPEAKKVDELLKEMQSRRVHMAIVVDEYGGTAGIVTLEDIVEEIVGEIHDEYDQIDETLYNSRSDDEVEFVGRISLDDFNDILDTHLASEDADTLGGYISSEIGRVPAVNDRLTVEEWVLTVEQVSGRRIRKVVARRKHETPTEESPNGSQR